MTTEHLVLAVLALAPAVSLTLTLARALAYATGADRWTAHGDRAPVDGG